MLIAIDIGNTNIVFGGYDNDILKFVFRLETKNKYNCDEYIQQIKMSIKPYILNDITDIVISSVVPKALEQLLEVTKKFSNVTPLIISHELKLGINLIVDNPETLGTDFIASGVAASKLYPLPVVIFDFGTTTKFSVVDKEYNFLGCGITSGIKTSMNSLFDSTAKISQTELAMPRSVIGTNTEDAIASGIIYGATSFVDGIAERIRKELRIVPTLILTGGLCSYIYGNTKENTYLAPNLILDGLKMIYQMKNQ